MTTSSAPVWVGVDVGGTKVLAGVVDDHGRVVRVGRRWTPGRDVTPEQVEDALTAAVLEAAAGSPIAAVGVAAAGFVDQERALVRFAPHLPWRDLDLRRRLAHRWQVPVALDNDANCAGLAEARFGAARGERLVVVTTLGTGIGGCLLLDGVPVRGRNGMAGEFGHMQVVPEGRACECGGSGCWEQYASGNALVRAATVDSAGGEPTPGRNGPAVTAAAIAGDTQALTAFARVGHWLGVGLANIVAAIDPDLVVIGGGLGEAGDLLLGPATRTLRYTLVGGPYRRIPPVRIAALGAQAGLVGAAVLARDASA